MQHLAVAEAHEHEVDLGQLWFQLTTGQAVLSNTHNVGPRAFGEVTIQPLHKQTPVADATDLARFFRGVSQKCLAFDNAVSAGTMCLRCAIAVRLMAPAEVVSRASMLLVAAAHAAYGTDVDAARVEHQIDARRTLISWQIPRGALEAALTFSEREVAFLLVRGSTHDEIAKARQTSIRTIANQSHSIFRKLGVSGRSELRSKAITEAIRRPGLQMV